jgi:hypothetical protein
MECINKFRSLKPKIKYSIIIGSIVFVIAIITIIIIVASIKRLTGTNVGAYLKTPDASKLEYRMGAGWAGFDDSWTLDNGRSLMQYAGFNSMRKKLPEQHFDNWGYGIELGVCEVNERHGISDLVGYLCTPSKIHSSNLSDPEFCYPDNLYKPIWLSNGKVNPNNYWANYVYKTVNTYKKYVKIWETWNEPDYVRWGADTGAWATSPPKPEDLVNWKGTIFQYIRLLRITYEVAKKVDPDCWVATGGLGYPDFLDAIMRYTDNPVDGSLTKDYPGYGGAYFDCDCYHKYPKWGTVDIETGEGFHDSGSDSHAKKVVILKKDHDYITKKYGFGDKYPPKIFVATETGLDSVEGEDITRRNWIIKTALMCLEYDVKQHHQLVFTDDGKGMGDIQNLGSFKSLEEGYTHLKRSSIGRTILYKMNLGKYIFDKEKTQKFREKLLPANITGMVLKRKFPKVENESYYFDYMYSVWRICVKEEVEGQIETELDIPFDPLKLDWEGNEKQMKSNSKFIITNTPIFLLGNESSSRLSGLAIFFIIFGILIGLVIMIIIGLYCLKRFIKKQDIPFDKNLIRSLIK